MSCRGDGTRPGAKDRVSPPLAPSQGCEQETTSAETTGQRHEAGRQGRSLPSSRSQSRMRAGDDVRREDGATARGRVPGTESPLLSLPVRDASRRRRPPRRRGDGMRPGAGVCFPPPPSRSQSGMRAGDDDGGTTKVRRGRTNQEYFRPGRP